MDSAGGAPVAHAIASGQAGVISRGQALVAGVSRSRIDDLVRRRRWVRVHPRVYRVATAPMTTAAHIHAASLWGGPTAVVAGPAAAWWWGLAPPPGPITLIVPPPARRPGRPGVTVIRGTVGPPEVVLRNGLLVTSIARTCLDLARSGEPDRLETALRLRRTDPAQLRASLDSGCGRRGQTQARLALDGAGAAPWNFRERLLHRYLRDAGISGWAANQPIRLRRGERCPDIALQDVRLAVVMHGHRPDGDARSAESGRSRNNDFVEAGWTVLHFSWDQLTEDAAAMISTLVRTIEALRQQRRVTIAAAGP